jgi:carbonic anhydrase
MPAGLIALPMRDGGEVTNPNAEKRKSKKQCLFAALCVSVALSACKTGSSPETTRAEGKSQTPAEEPAPTNASEALALLQKGNERFVAGSPRHGHESVDRRKELIAEQHPFATVLGCSDSRVPPELLFDQGFGDLFVVRVAGNVVATDDLGSIEYAVDHLHTPLLLVLGHEGCGAVTAALEPETLRNKEAKDIQELLALILPGLKGIDPKLSPSERVSRGVESNVRWSMKQLQNSPDLREKIAGGHLRIVGGVYELETGKVRLLS